MGINSKRHLAQFPFLLIVLLLLLPLVMTVVEVADRGLRRLDRPNNSVNFRLHHTLLAALDGIRRQLANLEGAPLIGVRKDSDPPNWSLEGLMEGKLQKTFENWLNEALPFRSNIVRLVNQIYYDVFFKSYMYRGGIIVGLNRQLFEFAYISKYCNLTQAALKRSDFERWIDELEELSAFFKQRGQVFVYLITPSKAAYFPEFIPAQIECKSRPLRPEYALAAAALHDSGIPYVDASKVVLEAKGKYEVEMFPRGGTHWNMLGAGLATRELLKTISTHIDTSLPMLDFTYHIDHLPSGTDLDLLSLANLWRPDLNYPVPHLMMAAKQMDSQKKYAIAMVGGSFLGQIQSVMIQSKFFNRIDYFNYFKIFHKSFPERPLPPVDENDPSSYRELLEADIVVVEENESSIRPQHSRHLQLLRAAVLSHGGQRNIGGVRPNRDK